MKRGACLLTLAVLAPTLGCSSDGTITTYTIGGNLAGLAAQQQVVLRNNNTDPLELVQNGAFTFPMALEKSFPYNVSIDTQPSTQQCVVAQSNGTLAASSITSVQVTCSAFGPFSVGGSITGLPTAEAIPVVLANGTDAVSLVDNGNFMFPTSFYNNTSYNVTVLSTPANLSCGITAGGGAIAGGNVTSIEVACQTVTQPTYALRGVVQGLAGDVTLHNSNGDSVTVAASGSFVFPLGMTTGVPYAVTVATQPAGQQCIVTDGTGIIADSDINSLVVACSVLPPAAYHVGGSITGLQGSITLQNTQNGDVHTQAADGTYAFPTLLSPGTPYTVVVQTAPNDQNCSVSNPNGVVGSTPVADVAVTCTSATPPTYQLAGTVTGFAQLVRLTFNLTIGVTWGSTGTSSVTVTQSGGFSFPTRLPDGAAWQINLGGSPTNYSCSASPNSGTIAAADFTTVVVTCTPSPTYTVGGTMTDLSGTVILQNNGSDALSVSSPATTFTFPTSHGYMAGYAVSVLQQPAGQICSVSSASGHITGNVTSVNVSCTTSYTIGGMLQGNNEPATLSLAIGGGNTRENLLARSAGPYQFITELLAGQTYAVSVTAGVGQSCLVTNAAGTAPSANVTTVLVSCANPLNLTAAQAANFVIGQANFSGSSANQGGTPDANTISLPSGNPLIASNSVAYLPDSGANRLVSYANLLSSPDTSSPTAILGQSGPNDATATTSASGFSQPQSVTSDGNVLVVADTNNNRLMVYNTLPGGQNPNADGVLGQADFVSSGSACSGGFNAPSSVFLRAGGPFLVADTQNHRVLIWLTLPADTAVPPDVVLGQGDAATCTAAGTVSATSLSAPTDAWTDGQRVAVVDGGANRVLIWNTWPATGQAADAVLGQTSMAGSGSGISATALSAPSFLTTNGVQLVVADSGNNRLLLFDAFPQSSSAAASLAVGQPTLSSNNNPSCQTGTATATQLCAPAGVSLQDTVLWVTDRGYNRYVAYVGH